MTRDGSARFVGRLLHNGVYFATGYAFAVYGLWALGVPVAAFVLVLALWGALNLPKGSEQS